MGADLIVSWFTIKKEKRTEKGLKETRDKMLKAVDKINIKDLNEMEGYMEDHSFEEEIKTETENIKNNEKDLRKKIISSLIKSEDNKNYIEASKKILKNVIEETFDSIGYRDVAEIEHKGEVIFLSGGMSWGDTPTNSCETFEKFNSLPRKILNAGGIK
jgi:hypothetical protein